MKLNTIPVLGTLLAVIALAWVSTSATAEETDARTIVTRTLNSYYYAGDDMRGKVSMRLISAQGRERKRELIWLRKNTGEGQQRYYIYFVTPSDVKGISFLVWKYSEKEDDRWIFIPAIKLVRRIAADDKRSSFVGSDFSYEDLSGRAVDDETHTLLHSDELDGRPVYVVESKPKIKIDYVRRVSWIDRERWLPLKEEFFDSRGQKARIFTAKQVMQIDGHWTATLRIMENPQLRHRTETLFYDIKYDIGLKQDLFTERYLRNPPRKWLR